MGGQNHWERQRREIDSYNIFYSAFYGVDGGSTLKDLGFKNPYRFPEIPVRNQSNPAEPDVAVYNGETLLLVEIKSGKNATKSHLNQMERCNNVSIEDGEDWLKDAKIEEKGMSHTDLEQIESAIVYVEERLHKDILPYGQDLIEDISEIAVVLSQSRGGKLSTVMGEFEESTLDSFFSSGISLPDVPPQTIYLNEGVEKESLAVSICFDHVMRDLKNGRVILDPSKVDDIYQNRAISIDDIVKVLDFLAEIGACRPSEEEYVFEQGHQRNIFKVKEVVSEKRVDEYMDYPDEIQKGIGDF